MASQAGTPTIFSKRGFALAAVAVAAMIGGGAFLMVGAAAGVVIAGMTG